MTENPLSIRNARIARLNNAAWAYILSYLPGKGLDCVYRSALHGDETSLAILDWIMSIWGLYYERKESLPDGDVPEGIFDFSSVGPMPCTVPELTAEVYA